MTASAAASASAGSQPSIQRSGRVKRTLRPAGVAKHSAPRNADGFRSAPKPSPSLPARCSEPRRRATASASSARVSGSPASALGHGGEDAVDLVLGHPEAASPGRLLPAGGPRALGADPRRGLLGGQQMQRAAHGPGLHELAPLDRLLDPAAWEAVDPRPERQLGRARDLRMQAADVLDDGHCALARHALGEVLTTESPGEDGGPAEHGTRLGGWHPAPFSPVQAGNVGGTTGKGPARLPCVDRTPVARSRPVPLSPSWPV